MITLQRDTLIRELAIEELDFSICRQSCHHERSSNHQLSTITNTNSVTSISNSNVSKI